MRLPAGVWRICSRLSGCTTHHDPGVCLWRHTGVCQSALSERDCFLLPSPYLLYSSSQLSRARERYFLDAQSGTICRTLWPEFCTNRSEPRWSLKRACQRSNPVPFAAASQCPTTAIEVGSDKANGELPRVTAELPSGQRARPVSRKLSGIRRGWAPGRA